MLWLREEAKVKNGEKISAFTVRWPSWNCSCMSASERPADNPAHALLSRCSTLICPHNSLDFVQPFQNNLLLLWLRLLSGAVFVFFVLQSEGWKPNCADACRIILNVSAAEAGVNADTGYGSPSEVDSVERDKEKKR